MGKVSQGAIQAGVSFEIGTGTSDNAIAAVLSQGGRPAAFVSRTLSHCEKRYPVFEKEATAVIETVCKWQHFLKGRYFTIVTDQEAISFIFDQRHHGKIKTQKYFVGDWNWDNITLIFDINPTLSPIRLRMCSAAPGISPRNAQISWSTRLCSFLLLRSSA